MMTEICHLTAVQLQICHLTAVQLEICHLTAVKLAKRSYRGVMHDGAKPCDLLEQQENRGSYTSSGQNLVNSLTSIVA
jgi:hypothetical protein